MAIRVPEKVVQSHIVQLLKSVGGRVYVHGTVRRRGDFPGTMQSPGWPDVGAFLPRRDVPGKWRFLFVECKAAGGRLRPEQTVFRELCYGADVTHLVGDLDVVIAWLIQNHYLSPNSVAHYRVPKDVSA